MTKPTLSVQLYTVRDQLEADLNGTLARLSAMGLRTVEAFDFVRRAPELRDSLVANGLRAATGHAPLLSTEMRFDDQVHAVPSFDEVFAASTTLGLEIVIDPFVSPERWLDEESVVATAQMLNAAAERAADHGLRVGYHNHSQEFVASFGGRTAYEVFVDHLADSVVLEVDLFWVQTAKQDVPAVLGRLGDRVTALHVKDGIVGADPFGPGADAVPPPLDQRSAGKGEVPLLEYMAAAPSTEYAIIEFDHYDGDIFEGIQGSVDYLTANGVSL